MPESTTSHVLNMPQTARKIKRPHKKPGRKGNKIDVAFKEIPTIAVEFEAYVKTHGTTANVLRQIKRHDHYKDNGQVFIRKNKKTKLTMIWREEPVKT